MRWTMTACLLSLAVLAAVVPPLETSAGLVRVRIRGYIDGRSLLILQGNALKWQHWDYDAPGRADFVNLPTQVNGVDWYPTWPDVPDSRNRWCGGCESSTYNPDPALPDLRNFTTIEPVGSGCRTSCTVTEAPTEGNGYRLVIEFNDAEPGGAAWYEIDILTTYDPAVGGLAELPQAAQAPASDSGSSDPPYAALAGGLAAAAALALIAGAWYARRRWNR